MPRTRLVHVDTDFGGDPDDACALAMLLGWRGVEVTGVTTNLDADGGRAACAEYVLALARHDEIPVAAGASESMTTGRRYGPTLGEPRCWPASVRPAPGAPGAASALLTRSIERGATIAAIGALTNLARLEQETPGILAGVPLVVMGGRFRPPPRGYPQWGADMDFNVQCDTVAAEIVFAVADVTFVPLSVAIRAQLRGSVLDRLRVAGAIGALLAAQSEAHRDDNGFADLARDHSALPDDLVNFHWDPVAAAVAAGWEGARVEACESPPGARVVVDIDADALAEHWLACIESL